MGTALRKLKRENPGLGRKDKITDGTIDKLQNYYGIAIRSNVGNLAGMMKSIHASLVHCASNVPHQLHNHCPPCSRCWYHQDKPNKTSLYKHGPGLTLPEYVRLSEESLLEICLHGKTQNQNEALNRMI